MDGGDLRTTSTRVATLRTEIAILYRANEFYLQAVRHTLFETQEQVRRRERLEQIKVELSEMANGHDALFERALARKPLDWAA